MKLPRMPELETTCINANHRQKWSCKDFVMHSCKDLLFIQLFTAIRKIVLGLDSCRCVERGTHFSG